MPPALAVARHRKPGRRLGCSWLAMNLASFLADLGRDEALQAA